MTISLTKDPLRIAEAARAGICAEVLLAMGPRIELNRGNCGSCQGCRNDDGCYNDAPLIDYTHSRHNTIRCQVGAPGIGTRDYCWDCTEYFNDHSRILDPAETV